jgi:hypothetical protein
MAKKQAPDTRPEIYVSTDVEADGPIPGPHSMLSFASAAMLADKTVLGTFSANLETLPGAAGHPVQMQWWKTQPEAWAACRRDLERPEDVMPRYVSGWKACRASRCSSPFRPVSTSPGCSGT